MALGLRRVDCRKASSSTGATLGTSSPSTKTASAKAASWSEAERTGPLRRMSMAEAEQLRLGVAGSRVEVLGPHEAAQGEIGFQGSPRRADPDDATRSPGSGSADLGQGRLLRYRHQSPVPIAQRAAAGSAAGLFTNS